SLRWRAVERAVRCTPRGDASLSCRALGPVLVRRKNRRSGPFLRRRLLLPKHATVQSRDGVPTQCLPSAPPHNGENGIQKMAQTILVEKDTQHAAARK